MRADVLAYLVENPSAQDTLEGIVEWWLLDRHVAHEAAAVRDVLEELTKRGFVLRRNASDSRTHYRINREKYDEIQTVLTRARRTRRVKVRS